MGKTKILAPNDPVWEHVKIVHEAATPKGKPLVECNHCDCPELQTVAMLVLSQPSSACPCETNWSTYKFVHSPERNRLDPARAESLVFVHTNLRLLRKLEALDYHERFSAHPSGSESDSDTEEAVKDGQRGWASEDSDEGELGSKDGSHEDRKEDSEGSPQC